MEFLKIFEKFNEIYQIKDIDILLERLLKEARNITNADAGSIYLKEDNKLKIKYSQNDTIQNRIGKDKKLIYLNFSIPIDKNTISGYVASTGEIVNIEDAYNLEDDLPFNFNSKYDEISNYRTKSILTFPIKIKNEVIGVLQLINAKNKDGEIVKFPYEIIPIIMHFANNAGIAIERALMTREMILRMVKMTEIHDPKETGAHVNRVGAYSVELYENWAKKRKIKNNEIEKVKDILRISAMLHDIGKIAISDIILKKPGKLTKEEFEEIKKHTFLGARLFLNRLSDFDQTAYEIALNHHERWDGKGYPGFIDVKTGKKIKEGGKKGEEIPFLARIVSVADVFDALISKRSYKEAWSDEKIKKVFMEERGKQFDPEIVDSLFECYDILKSIKERYPDEE